MTPSDRPKKVYARLPKTLIGKDLNNLTPEEEKDLEAFAREFAGKLAESDGRDPKTGKKLRSINGGHHHGGRIDPNENPEPWGADEAADEEDQFGALTAQEIIALDEDDPLLNPRDEETTEDSGRIDPNVNPDDFEAPPPDYELLTYQELLAEAKAKGKRRSQKS